MIETYDCKILSGGFYHCNHQWLKKTNPLDKCFKIYYPVRGEAGIILEGKKYTMHPDHVYFICGYKIQEQFCTERMDVYWIHFVPDSLYLKYILQNSDPIYSWNKNELYGITEILCEVNKLFNFPHNEKNKLLDNRPPDIDCLTRGVIMLLTGKILKSANIKEVKDYARLQKLKSSIDFINTEYLRNPSLKEIAQKSNLSGIYFHKIFTATFSVSPLEYMTRKRLHLAAQLLNDPALSIKQIAFKTGYDNEFYFSRIFKKFYGMSPAKYRKTSHF